MEVFNPFVSDMLQSISKGLDPTDKDNLPFQKEEGSFKRYYPNQCQICYCIDNEKSPLKRCSRCHLVSYCSKDHQAKDYKQHKSLCKVLSELGGPRLFQDLKKTEYPKDVSFAAKVELSTKRSILKHAVLSRITTKLDRKPFLYELQIVNFPRVCSVCFESDPALLRSCANCPQSSFCEKHGQDKTHSKYCSGYNLAREIELDKVGKSCFELEMTQLKTFHFPCQQKKSSLPSSMKNFIKNNCCLRVKRNAKLEGVLSKQLWDVYLSESICLPLTILYSLEKLKLQVESNLVLHVIGSSRHEMQSTFWELILHWLPAVTRLDMVFIGPELRFLSSMDKETTPVQICRDCKARKLNFHTFDGLYENYVGSENYLKPTMLAAFNAGFHAYATWSQAFEKMASLHCPLICTAFSDMEAFRDHDWFKSCVSGAEYFSLEANPFAGFRCERSPEEEKVFVHNEYLTIYDSL
ncbi:uncharacterized protein LOC117168246 [Belonocnema kinseyi]|uniref:uncharacterized protein LOC117168246 n=1 Tax=Belonocnema kinseyi TaxID=2817044 RepID=UPI00143DF36A|nr:uncharacterized protein LOC117168246 [Belonocnema kinseyi]